MEALSLPTQIDDQMSLDAVPIQADDFRFVGYADPAVFFAPPERPYRLIQSPPALEAISNAIYTPATRSTKPFDGTLYDEQLRRVESACLWRRTTDLCMNSDPQRFEGNPETLPSYDGTVLYLGFLNPHYGHFLLESLSRWWALSQVADTVDAYVVHVHDPSVLELPYVRNSMAAMNISPSKVLWFTEPTRLKQVIVPQSTLQLDGHIFSRHRQLMNRLALAYYSPGSARTDQPLYVSRTQLRSGVTRYIGEQEIEDYLSGQGARIMHPQTMSFEEQVRAFNEHPVIIGLNGSGMHNTVFSIEPKTIVSLAQDRIIATSFLLDRCFDADSTFLFASSRMDRYRLFSEKLSARLLPGSKGGSKPFLRTRYLDHKRVIKWFKQSGYV